MTETKQKSKPNWLVKSLLIVLALGTIGGAGYAGYDFKQQYDAQQVHLLAKSEQKSISDCKILATATGKYIDTKLIAESQQECESRFSLENQDLNQNFCALLATKSRTFFEENYFHVDKFGSIQKDCFNNYFKKRIEKKDILNVHNDFKSTLSIYNHNLFDSNSNLGPDEKQQLSKFLEQYIRITPATSFNHKDIKIYEDFIEVSVNLKPNTDYKVYTTGEEKDALTFSTPDQKYIGFHAKKSLSLYTPSNLPQFELLEFHTEIETATIEICKINEENYAKLEVFRSSDIFEKDANTFFAGGMPTFSKDNCTKKSLPIPKSKDNTKLNRVAFNFDTFLQDNNGLYFVQFADEKTRTTNGTVTKPFFFGVINSHIMMKVAKSGETYFFVNDLQGNPLANQEISIYLNEYFEKDIDADKNKSPLNNDIFTKPLSIGTTNEQGILSINLNKKIADIFEKTFGEDDYNFVGKYNHFFVKANSKDFLSYLSSTWNGGIEPWNFGYDVGWNYQNNEQQNTFKVGNNNYDTPFYSHVYTDRKLYLPNDTVYVRGIIRDKKLEIPSPGTEFQLTITNPNGDTITDTTITLNEYGSFSEKLALTKESILGNYDIDIKKENSDENYPYYVGYTNFNVEVFKNPKFKPEISIETTLPDTQLVNITKQDNDHDSYYYGTKYSGAFNLNSTVTAKYYSGASIENADFSYKIFRQPYYSDEYWNDCYYGCYWEPEKEFYTEGTGSITNGIGRIDAQIDFESYYHDYKYIIEVTVTDKAGDSITGSNSIVAKLPENFKVYNYELNFKLKPEQRFAKVGEKMVVTGNMNVGSWSDAYNDKYVMVIKKKNYYNKVVTDVNGYTRNIQKIDENIQKIVPINTKTFNLKNGRLNYDFIPNENGEYIFEYGTINNYSIKNYFGIEDNGTATKKQQLEVLQKFINNNGKTLSYKYSRKNCSKGTKDKSKKDCKEYNYQTETKQLDFSSIFNIDTYFPVIAYGGKISENPIADDNKLDVISEKVSYKIGETAKILVRLPVENTKILITVEKDGIVSSEYINVKGNTFFKEFLIDDSFAPNSYISVFMVDTTTNEPQYKIGYTEVVIDKTEFKADIQLSTDKKSYEPREAVTLDIQVTNSQKQAQKSELTIIVVDDSLISLMGNINPNTLELIYHKLPFSMQTAMTNVAMVRNYYFSRMGIVGGSGEGNRKGGDSEVSTRNLFKNTAYYNPSVITDENGKAQVQFNLPDNLTNFRVMVLSNSKNNRFGYQEQIIETRKDIVLEDKTPLILRNKDTAKISAQLFNNSQTDTDFIITLEAHDIKIKDAKQEIQVKAGKQSMVFWEIGIDNPNLKNISYKISATNKSTNKGDSIEKTIAIQEVPILVQNSIDTIRLDTGGQKTISLNIPENTDFENSKIILELANSRIVGIEDIATSLATYPYGCIEQLTSSTLPNVILKNIAETRFPNKYDKEKIEKNIAHGIKKILDQQNDDGGFSYWNGDIDSSLHATPYVLRSLYFMKQSGVEIDESVFTTGIKYLSDNLSKADTREKTDIYETLAVLGAKLPELSSQFIDNGKQVQLISPENNDKGTILSRHGLLSYTKARFISEKAKSKTLDAFIKLLKEKMKEKQEYEYYWNSDSDYAEFVGFLIQYDYEKHKEYIETAISELYNRNWKSYYYSTQTKIQAFIAFSNYLEKQQLSEGASIEYRIQEKENGTLKVNNTLPISSISPTLQELTDSTDKKITLNIKNTGATTGYIQAKLLSYPTDIEKVQAYSNNIEVVKKVYAVRDEKNVEKCSENYYHYKEEEKVDCNKVLEAITNNTYKKGQVYLAKIFVKFPDTTQKRHHVTIEDYLPGSFSVINSKFQTNSSSLRQGTKNWNWGHVENKPDVVMAHTQYMYDEQSSYEYLFTADFTGTFTEPPVTAYLMYHPDTKAYSKFHTITVTE